MRLHSFVLSFLSIFSILPSTALARTMSIEEAVQEGLSSGLDLNAAKYEISLSEASQITSQLRTNPSLLIDSQLMPFKSNWNQSNNGGPTQRDIILSLPMDLTGKRTSKIEMAKLTTERAKLEFADFQRQKSMNIKTTYVHILALGDVNKILSQKMHALEGATSLLTQRASGSQPLLVSRVNIAVQRLKIRIESNQLELDVAQLALARLLGIPVTDLQLSSHLKTISSTTTTIPTSDLQKTFKARPDLQARLIQKSFLKSQQNFLDASVWDDFVFSAGFSRQEKSNSNSAYANSSSIPGAWSWIVGVSLPLPVFSRNQGSLQGNHILSLQNDLQIELNKREITTEVEVSTKQLETQEKQIQTFERLILKDADTLKVAAQRSFGSGSMSLFEYLDALDSSFESATEYYNLLEAHATTLFMSAAAKGEL